MTVTETISKPSTMSATSDLRAAAKQPVFNAWESLTPVDDFFRHEPRYEQWYRDLHTQEEAHGNFMLLQAALNYHQHDPALSKCLTGEVALICTPTFSPPAEQENNGLQDFEDMHDAVREVRRRRRTNTI
jgi:hypothetical protein